jgi:hypothetical protein
MVYLLLTNFHRKNIMGDTKTPDEEKPLAAQKDEEAVYATKVETADEHRARVIAHLASGDTRAAFQALMTDSNGLELDYAESRMRWG